MRGLILALPFLSACYIYAPLDTASTAPGTKVRARVSAATAEQIEPILGVTDARVISGTVVSTDPESFIVEVPSVMRAEIGSSIRTLNQRISIPRNGVVQLEIRKLDRFKTTVVVGGAALLLGSFIIKEYVIDPGKGSGPGGGGGPELRPRR